MIEDRYFYKEVSSFKMKYKTTPFRYWTYNILNIVMCLMNLKKYNATPFSLIVLDIYTSNYILYTSPHQVERWIIQQQIYLSRQDYRDHGTSFHLGHSGK